MCMSFELQCISQLTIHNLDGTINSSLIFKRNSFITKQAFSRVSVGQPPIADFGHPTYIYPYFFVHIAMPMMKKNWTPNSPQMFILDTQF